MGNGLETQPSPGVCWREQDRSKLIMSDQQKSSADKKPESKSPGSPPPPEDAGPAAPPAVPTSVVLHPLVLLSVVDHYNRVTSEKSQRRVVGILLGTSFRGVVDVTNSYAGAFVQFLSC